MQGDQRTERDTSTTVCP